MPPPDPPASTLWPRPHRLEAGSTARRWPRRTVQYAACVLAVLLVAAWSVPPLLDWGRFRAGFAAIAAAQLGRPVQLGGQITLRLLPEAVLTATDVSLPDQGDGLSAQLGSMRLQVAVLPLLAGRIVPRDLILGAPVLHLPWPLPQALTYRSRPLVPRGFAAHMEGGTLLVGQVQVTGINAGIHGGPEPGTVGAQPDAAASAFGAEGFAALGGRTWRFTSALGAPDADGVSALDLSVTGQGAAGTTGGAVQATLADGVVQGRLRAGGPDLSLLLSSLAPAAALPWRIEAPFIADHAQIQASAIDLSLGTLPAEASLGLRLALPTRLDGQVHAPKLNLDGLARLLAGIPPGGPAGPTLPFRLALSADEAHLLGGTLARLQGALAWDGTSLRLENAQATLPGQALLQASGAVTRSAGGLQLSGPASLDAPDLHTIFAWLHGVAPGLADAVPLAVLRHARLAGQMTLAQHGAAASNLSGELDGADVSGGFGVTLGPHPRVDARISLAQLSLDDWLGRPAAEDSLAATAQRFTQIVSDLHIRADRAGWHGLTLGGLVLDARTGPAGLVIDRAQAVLSGAALSAKAALGPDGTVTGASLTAGTQDASTLLELLPPAWRLAPGLWTGAASLKAAVSGPPDGLSVQLRADAGDLVMEADWRADTPHQGLAGTVTLRHPGAPRLLASLGMPGADTWLETGSLALRAQVSLQPGRVSVPDFDLAAADLRMSGQLALDLTAIPFLRGMVAAETLALPGPAEMPALLDRLPDWSTQLAVTAQQIRLGGRPALADLTATLGLGGGNGLLDVTQASTSGGQLTGQLAYAGGKTAQLASRAALTGAHVEGPVSGLPIDLLSGDADASIDLQASGADVAAWRRSLSGQIVVTLRGAQVSGFDLGQAGRLLSGPPAGRAALQAVLPSRNTPGLSGEARLDAAQGHLSVAPATMTSPDGAVLMRGWVDGGGLDLTFGLVPNGAPAKHLAIRMSGPFGAVRAVADLGSAGVAARRPRRR